MTLRSGKQLESPVLQQLDEPEVQEPEEFNSGDLDDDDIEEVYSDLEPIEPNKSVQDSELEKKLE